MIKQLFIFALLLILIVGNARAQMDEPGPEEDDDVVAPDEIQGPTPPAEPEPSVPNNSLATAPPSFAPGAPSDDNDGFPAEPSPTISLVPGPDVPRPPEPTSAEGYPPPPNGFPGVGPRPPEEPSPEPSEELSPEPSASEEPSPEEEAETTGNLNDIPSPTPTEEVCFPGSATVELESGETKTMRQLEVGDRVRVGSNEFSAVFMFTHKLSESTHTFVLIKTESGHSLRATKNHYIPTSSGQLVAAGSLRRNDVVFLADGTTSSIVSLKSVRDNGLYNPQTVHGDIVVNGIVASTYTKSVAPKLASVLLAPLRSAFTYLGYSTSALESGSSFLASIAPSGGDRVRWLP